MIHLIRVNKHDPYIPKKKLEQQKHKETKVVQSDDKFSLVEKLKKQTSFLFSSSLKSTECENKSDSKKELESDTINIAMHKNTYDKDMHKEKQKEDKAKIETQAIKLLQNKLCCFLLIPNIYISNYIDSEPINVLHLPNIIVFGPSNKLNKITYAEYKVNVKLHDLLNYIIHDMFYNYVMNNKRHVTLINFLDTNVMIIMILHYMEKCNIKNIDFMVKYVNPLAIIDEENCCDIIIKLFPKYKKYFYKLKFKNFRNLFPLYSIREINKLLKKYNGNINTIIKSSYN